MELTEKLDNIINQLNRIERIAFDVRSPWLTIDEATKYIKLSKRTLQRWFASGILKSYRLPGRGRRILRKDLDSITLFGKQYKKLISTQKKMVNDLTKDQ